ncbi:MAG TPA: hypothetical protein VFZ02_06185 [Ktedonobacteraceae bacterium]
MGKKSLITSSEMRSVANTAAKRILYPHQNSKPSMLWLWITSLLIIGVIILGAITSLTWQWLNNVHVTLGAGNTQPTITTFNVQRIGTYANLSFTVLNAQYASSFPNDTIQTGPALVRLNLRVTNKSTDQISVIYYDVARLLAPGSKPIAPTYVHLSTGPKPGSSEVGWIDFPVTNRVRLSTLRLQLGSLALNETPLIIPFSGPFDPNHFAGKTSAQTLTIWYNFSGNTLVYHLKSVNILFAYRGTQAKVGQQFYVLNFTVDNDNGVTVSPGYGFDYIRLIINGYNTPPIDNTLPHGFNAGAHGVAGRVVYVGPAGLKTLDFAFLLQVVQGQDPYNVNLQ